MWEDRPANYRRVLKLLDRAEPREGDLVVMPEMFDTGFSFKLETTADRDGQTLKFIQALAKETGTTVVGSRTVVGADARGRNRCTVAGPDGRVLCEYDKIHPFSHGKESEHFTGGEAVCTFDWVRSDGPMRVCPTICYDLRFPELFRLGMLAGAEVFTVIANWPVPRKVHRRALAVARAIENQAYVVCVNRAGNDPHLMYQGESFVVGPKGDVLAEAGVEESVLSVELPIEPLRAWRREFPAWKDIRLIGS